MNAAFFGLAVLAALNPKLFAVDLLLVENARPRLTPATGPSSSHAVAAHCGHIAPAPASAVTPGG
jgi:hypothetical protein